MQKKKICYQNSNTFIYNEKIVQKIDNKEYN